MKYPQRYFKQSTWACQLGFTTVPSSIQKVIVIMSCGSEKARHFGGAYHLHFQSRRVSQGRNHKKQAASRAQLLLLVSCLAFFFDTEDGGDMFFSTVMLSPNYMASQPA
jgi:hypothetical protein